MFKKVKILLLMLILGSTFLMTGCLTEGLGPKFTQAIVPESGKAIIYVYRGRSAFFASDNPGVLVNDVRVVKHIFQLSYFSLSVDPGQYIFKPKLMGIYKTTEGNIKAEAGKVYFVRIGFALGHIKFEEVNRDEAMASMATCYQLDPKYALDPRVITAKNSSVQRPVKEAPQTAKTVEKESINAPVYEAEQEVFETPKQELVEEKNNKVDLEPEFLEEAEPEKVTATKPGPITVVKTIEGTKVPAGLQPEEKRYAEMLNNGSLTDIRNAAKNIYYRYYQSDYLIKMAEQTLLENYEREASNLQVDAMAWLCKVLGRTGDRRFADTLKIVSEKSPNRKLRGHALKNLNNL